MCDKTGSNFQSGQDAVPRRGLRCQICTGCGLCPGVIPNGSGAGGLHVLTEDALFGEQIPLEADCFLAVADIGTTTVAMLLYGRDGSVIDRHVAVNPQVAYGADVLSRIRAAEDKKAAEKMKDQVRQVLKQGIQRFRERLGPEKEMYLVLAANTVMTYLFMGWDPSELGRAPFKASHLSGAETKLSGVPCFVFPGLSAFVGGDIAAGIYACGMCEKDGLTLLLDLGTNGEIVLGNRGRRIACSTAAGPAFEGGANRGVWGADMISLLAHLRREGILDETGLLADEYFERGIRIGNVTVTQEAVRNVQLAKGAIAAGIEILLEKYGAEPKDVERVVLAGGFGYYLKPELAAQIGLLPGELAGRTLTGGNTALSGALLAGRRILADDAVAALDGLLSESVLRTETINLAEEPKFAKRYVELMNLEKS